MSLSAKLRARRGFTLIELMIVVAIVGILAVLAVFGVRRYLANAKSAEASGVLGHVNRLAVAAYERERSSPELVVAGGLSGLTNHFVCTTSTQVPAAVPVGRKYTAATVPGSDYQTGSSTAGWRCLRFEMTQPQYFAYKYTNGAAPTFSGGTTPAAPAVVPVGVLGWSACASGDLGGDLKNSLFCLGGALDAQQIPKTMTSIAEVDPEE